MTFLDVFPAKAILDTVAAKVFRPACESLARRLPCRVIYDRNGTSPYLSRFYFLGRRSCDDKDEPRSAWSLPFNLFLHKFHRGDDDGALHSHPWKWSVALILAGGYSDERGVGDSVVRRLMLPLSVNVIRADDYHRVDLLDRDAWTLFLAGPRVGTWYFWDRDLKARARWDKYINWLFCKADPGWEADFREGPAKVNKIT